MPDQDNDLLEPITTAPEEVQRIIKRVLKLEKEKLYLSRPHISSDITKIIKEEIR